MMNRIFVNIEWYILRMLLAAFCGAAVGFERKRRHKDAGIRTHVLVAIGSALFSILSEFGFEGYGVESRVAANIVTGVGFLGAGVIFLRGRNVTGLTTAAGIWTVAGIGMAAGLGEYGLAVAAAMLVVVLQFLMHWLYTSHELKYWNISLVLPAESSGREIREILGGIYGVEIEEFRVVRQEQEGMLVKLTCVSKHPLQTEQAIRLLKERSEIVEISG